MHKKELINMLLYDVALEHSAIVQYLYHIFLISDAEITSEIEEIARQEMRHLKWFAQKVVQLGGSVVLERVEEAIMIGGPNWEDMLQKDVDAEQMAIDVYSKQLDMIDDDSVKRLLERVIKDEQHHKFEFSELAQKAKESVAIETDVRKADPEVIEVLNKFLKEEYQIIIKYLYQFFHSKDCTYKDIMLDLAIESMVHMGKLGEKIGELGGMPQIQADFTLQPTKALEREVREEIEYESATGRDYAAYASKIQDPDIRRLFEFINHQEEYHKQKLVEFFKVMKRFTVGDLRKND